MRFVNVSRGGGCGVDARHLLVTPYKLSSKNHRNYNKKSISTCRQRQPTVVCRRQLHRTEPGLKGKKII
jgi:hypothetical protein